MNRSYKLSGQVVNCVRTDATSTWGFYYYETLGLQHGTTTIPHELHVYIHSTYRCSAALQPRFVIVAKFLIRTEVISFDDRCRHKNVEFHL